MNELTVANNNLPSNIEDLSALVVIDQEKLKAVNAQLRAMKRLGFAEEAVRLKTKEAQQLAEQKTYAEMMLGKLTAAMPTSQGKRSDITSYLANKKLETKQEALERVNVSPVHASQYERMAAHPDIVEEALAEARENGDIVSRASILKKVKQKQKADDIEQARQDIEEQQKERGGAILRIGDGIGFSPIEKYDLLLTDPPYSTDVPDVFEFANRWLYPALAGVKDTGFAYVFIGAYPNELQAYLEAVKPSNVTLEQVLIWTYKNTLGQNPKGRYKQNYQACLFFRGVNAPDLDCPLTSEQWAVQEINAPDGRQGDRYHAWQKPMEIAERFIRHSTKQGMTVFDPFACTGTFLLAAAKLGRKAYGFEIDPDNAEIAFQRGCVRG